MLVVRRFTRICDGYSVFERVFWTIAVTISSYGLGIFSFYTFERYASDPVRMTLETEYLNWNLSFPAVSVCLAKGKTNQPNNEIMKILNISANINKRQLLKDINHCMFMDPNLLDWSIIKCMEFLSPFNITINELKNMILPNRCNEFIDFFEYAGNEYNCTDVLNLHKESVGYCFIANSIRDYDYSFDKLKLKYNRETKTRTLSMRLKSSKFWQYTIFIHSPEEVPSYNSISKDVYSTEMKHSVHVEYITTDSDSSLKSIPERRCRFPLEKLDDSPFHYSFATCIIYLRIKMELETCNCTQPSSPEIYKSRYCNVTGMECLMKENLFTKAYRLAIKQNICIPSCIEQILEYVGQSEMKSETNTSYTDISVEVVNMGTIRLKRIVTHSELDLGVSIAGLAGLFFGVSVLNFVELLYFLITGK